MTIKDNTVQTKPTNRKRRGSSRYYLYFILILLALAGLGTGSYYLLSNLSLLNLKKVVVSGNASVADSLILGVTRPYLGQNILTLPRADISARLVKFGRIKEVSLRRRLLGTLKVVIEERKGCLYLKSLEGDLFPVDDEAVVLEQYGSVYSENLPVMNVLLHNHSFKAGQKVKSSALQRVLAMHRQITREAPDFLPNISEYYTIDNLVYIVDARNGMRLIPSTKNLARQFRRYEFVQDNGNVGASSILDLRFDNQVVVKAGS